MTTKQKRRRRKARRQERRRRARVRNQENWVSIPNIVEEMEAIWAARKVST